jgi:hypothetical protein
MSDYENQGKYSAAVVLLDACSHRMNGSRHFF